MPGLSLLISLCLVRVLIKVAPADYKIKWPNDVLFNQQKIAGILIECKSDLVAALPVVIGVGINIKLPHRFIADIEYPVTDLYQISVRRINRNELLAQFLTELYQLLDVFRIKGFEPFREEWLKLHCYQNQSVVLNLSDTEMIEGIAIDVTNEGELTLQTESGYRNFSIGDISLRPKFQS